jgi:dipeptidyl aminopeptidase/acylaminoacyl peptidase
MHDDLVDASVWAAKSGVARADQIAIYGGSYGGYSALVGLTFTPTTFACAVDIVGPSNLVTLLENIPPYWAPFFPLLTTKLADPKSESGRAWLTARSPLSKVDQIQRPLLIGQGANDPRVKQAESDQIVKAMQARKIPVTYVLYPDEGHGFVRPENRKSFNAVAEAFLAQCLGGPYEPVGADFKGASITVPEGAEHVVGLKDALGSK